MTKLFYLAIVAILFVSCQNDNKNVAVINGQGFVNKQTIKFEWFKKNSVDFHPGVIEAKVDSSGSFTVEVPVEQMAKGMMVINNDRYDLVLKQNDQLFIGMENDSLLFSGEGAERNQFLYQLSKQSNSSKMEVMQAWYTTPMDFEQFIALMETYLETRKSAISTAKNALQNDVEFVGCFNMETTLDSLDLIKKAPLAYSRMNQMPVDSVQMPRPYNKVISLSEVVDDKYLKCYNYLYFLNGLVYDNAMKLMAQDSTLSEDQAKYTIIMDSLSMKTRENYLTQTIYMKLSIYDDCDSTYFMAFDSIKNDANCIAVVNFEKERYDKKKAMIGAPLHADFLNTMVLDTANNELTLGAVFAKSGQKVLYLDVWSLGCGPCRMAMPHSKKLKEQLDGQAVEFIYLTVDDYSDKLWDEVYEVSLTKNNHYRFAKGFSAKMLQLFNTMAVPTYMIVDKQGDLLSYKADRPFDNTMSYNIQLEQQLRELAQK